MTPTVRIVIRFACEMCVRWASEAFLLNSECLGGLDIASEVEMRTVAPSLFIAADSVSADTTPAKAFWCHYWPVSVNSNRRTFPLRPC